ANVHVGRPAYRDCYVNHICRSVERHGISELRAAVAAAYNNKVLCTVHILCYPANDCCRAFRQQVLPNVAPEGRPYPARVVPTDLDDVVARCIQLIEEWVARIIVSTAPPSNSFGSAKEEHRAGWPRRRLPLLHLPTSCR